jgi:hypothetical protein
MAADPTLDERIDALYAGSADEFIAARDALVKELRAAKDKDGAATVKALRKPTVAAWAVNRIVHEANADVQALAEIGDQLRAAHESLLEGDGDAGVREATARRRKAVSELTDRAVAELGGAGEAQREAISHTFDAVVADADAAAAVLAGRLTKELQPPSGFGAGLVFADASPTVRSSRPTAKPNAKAKTKREAPVDDGAQQRLAEAEAEAEAEADAEARRRRDEHVARLRSELDERKAEADDATRLADEAHEDVDRLQSELDAAEVRARDADTAARRARKAAEQAQRELDRAQG